MCVCVHALVCMLECVSHARRAATGSPLGTCKELSRLASKKAQHAQVTASWGEPRSQKPRGSSSDQEEAWHSLKSPETASRKGMMGGVSTKNTAEILWLLAPRREEPNPLNTLRGFRVGKELTSQVEARTLKALTSKAHQSRSAGTEPDPQKARIPRKRSGVWGEPPGAFPELLLARLLQPIAPRAPKRGGERAICERGRAKGEQHFCKRSPR